MLRIRNASHHHIIADEQHYYSESSIVQASNGDLLATSPDNRGLAHTDAGSIVLSRSRDGGRTWLNQPRRYIFKAGISDGYSSGPLSLLADGTLLCHADHVRYLVRVGDISYIAPRGSSEHDTVYVTRSHDSGQTWDTPWPARTIPMQGCFVRDGILELPDGTLLMPLSGTRRTISQRLPNDDDAFRSYLLRSDDRGETWYYYSTIALDTAGILNLWEPTITRLPSGRIVALLRSDYVHMIAPPGGELYCCHSDDDGASWSIPHRTPLWGYPADLITMRDGNVLATYGYRRDPLSVRVAFSKDGLVWRPEDMAVLRELPLRSIERTGPDFAALSPSPELSTLNVGFRHVGYPDSKELAGGRMLTVYHMWDEELRQSVECTVYEIDVDPACTSGGSC
jgi:sialidase-1